MKNNKTSILMDNPALVKLRYDSALNYSNKMNEHADNSPTRTRFERKEAKKMRDSGKIAVDETLRDAKDYAKHHGTALHEQAHEEMHRELAERDMLEGFANTLDEIKNLSEPKDPN